MGWGLGPSIVTLPPCVLQYLCTRAVVRESWEPSLAAELGTAQEGALLHIRWHVEVTAVGLTELARERERGRGEGGRGGGEGRRGGKEEGEGGEHEGRAMSLSVYYSIQVVYDNIQLVYNSTQLGATKPLQLLVS